jgi:hypothetical protein
VFDLESIKDPEGNVIREAPLPVWANFQQRAIDIAILEINTKTNLKIRLAGSFRAAISNCSGYRCRFQI